MKSGLYYEGEDLLFYRDGVPYHAGTVQVDGDIYYIGRDGKAVKGAHIVHGSMTNDVLKRGTYTFGDDFKLIPGSYIAPRKRRRRIRRKRVKVKKWMPYIVAAEILILLMGFFWIRSLVSKNVESVQQDAVAVQSEADEVILPTFEEPVLLCSELSKEVYDGETSIDLAVKGGIPYRPFEFSYTIPDKNGGLLYISEIPDMENSREYELPAEENSIYIDNLKTGTTYYYKVTVGEKEYSGQFETAKSTRFIHVDGIVNTRDLGGYTTLDGKTVKQGMIIRGTELDGLVEPGYYLDGENLEYFKSEFGFVYDLDLRESTLFYGDYQTRMGEDVLHKFYNSPMYGEIFNISSKDTLKMIFTDLANEDNYPIYLHCTYGADRTGTIVFLLQALLNMSQEDILCEYRRTGYCDYSYTTNTYMEPVINGLAQYPGNTIQEQVISFLKEDIGITDEQIRSIQSIILE